MSATLADEMKAFSTNQRQTAEHFYLLQTSTANDEALIWLLFIVPLIYFFMHYTRLHQIQAIRTGGVEPFTMPISLNRQSAHESAV